MRIVSIVAVLLALALVAPVASAVVLGLDWGLGLSPVRIQFNGHQEDVWAGGLNAYLGGTLGNPLPPNDGHYIGRVYCVDLHHNINVPTEYEVTLGSTLALANGGRAAWLHNTFAPQVTTATEAAALQLAIWDVVVDNGDGLGTGGFRYITGLGAAAVTSVGSLITSSLGHSSVAGYLDAKGEYGQDMITPIPEPATLGLLGFGLVASGLIVRRRQRK
jgi:hypothetical protein